jgi:hypothetical protein
MEIFVQERVGEVRIGWLYHIQDKCYTKVDEVGLNRQAVLVEDVDVPCEVKKAVQIMTEGE